MDEAERKKYPSLPPGYVSLAQLQERWLKKQQEKKLKEKAVEEKGKSTIENQNHGEVKLDGLGEMESEFSRNGPHRIVKQDVWAKGTAIIEGKEKGKGIEIDGLEDGEEKMSKKKKKKKKHYKKKKYVADEGEDGSCKSEGVGGEMKKNWNEGNEIITGEELKVGILGSGEGSRKEASDLKEMVEKNNACEVEVLSANGVREEIANVKMRGVRAGFRGNGDNLGSSSKGKEYRANKHGLDSESEMALEKKIEGQRRNGEDRRERRKNDDNQDMGHGLKENRSEMHELKLKDDLLELESEKAENQSLEFGSKIEGSKGRHRNRIWRQKDYVKSKIKERRLQGQDLNDNRMAAEKRTEDENLVMESAKNDEKGEVRHGFRRYEDRRWNVRPGRFKSWNTKQRDSCMMWVKKEEKSGPSSAEAGC